VEWANLRQACDWTLQAQRWEWTASFLGMAAQHLYARGDIYNELEEVTVVLYEGVQLGDVPLAALGANPQAQYSPQTLMVGVVDLACQLHYSGRSTEARHLLRQFLSDLQRAPDWETEARVWHQLAWMEHRLRNSTEATKCFERQWQIVRCWGDEKARVKTLLELGVFAREQRRLGDARVHLEEGLRLASQPGLEHVRADLLAHLCAVAVEERRFEEACCLGEDYIAQVRRNGTVLVLCRALQEQAERHLCVNEPDVAESLLRESVNAGRRVGTLGKLAWACLHLCKDILVPRGAYAEALPFQQEALAAARASHNDYITAVVLTDLAHFHLAQGDLAAARRCATDAHSFVQTPRGRKALPDLLVTRGCIYLAQNHWRAAERCLPQSVSLLREQNRSQAFAHALLHCGRLRHAQGKRDEARRCYEESLSLYYREDEQCRVRYHLALLDIEEGNTSQAAAALREILPICETWQWTLAQEAQKTLSDITHHPSPITHYSPLAIQLFGPFTVLRDGQPLSQPLWPRARQVLAYLALHRGKPVSRDALLDLLYADAPADRASFNRLERLVSRLRNVLGDKGWIRFSDSHYIFDPDGRARCDVEEFDALRKRAAQHRRAKRDDEAIAAWEAADALVRGDLMADIAREWVEVERDDFRERHRDLLLNLADVYARRKAYSDVVRVGQRVLALDPTDEPAHRFLMRAYAASGRRSDVVRQFELCHQILRNQLGVEPSSRTRRLYDNLCQDET
jgi:DNA-binding SARP family transcriptional activator